MATKVNAEVRANILTGLDKENQDSWLALVRLMAPQLCRTEPDFLVDILYRRAKLMSEWKDGGPLVQHFAGLLPAVGVKLEVAAATGG